MAEGKVKSQEHKNYKNFALAVVAILGIIFFVSIIGVIGFFDGLADRLEFSNTQAESYRSGFVVGGLMRGYFSLGLFLGNMFAVLTSLEKHKSLPTAILYGVLGWFYVVYYALTRKTVLTNY